MNSRIVDVFAKFSNTLLNVLCREMYGSINMHNYMSNRPLIVNGEPIRYTE